MARLPPPTEQQRRSFVEHVCWAHSWYKHIPFDERAQFAVFWAEDAGAGYETRQRPHHSWKTTAQYRDSFGVLDYAWKHAGDPDWRRDAGADVEPSDELLQCAGFTLGPTCSNDYNAIEVLCSLYVDAGSSALPATRARFVELDRLRRLGDRAYLELDDAERQAVVTQDFGDALTAGERERLATARVISYRDHDSRVHQHYASMRAPEVMAIEAALDRLAEALAMIRVDPPAG